MNIQTITATDVAEQIFYEISNAHTAKEIIAVENKLNANADKIHADDLAILRRHIQAAYLSLNVPEQNQRPRWN